MFILIISVVIFCRLTFIVLIFESQWAFEASSYNHLGNYSILEKNATGTDLCWLHEKYTVIEPCHLCSGFEIASQSNKACIPTHFKESVKCLKSGRQVFKSCDRVHWIEEKKFWQFEALMFVLCLTSSACVILRQKVLDQRHIRCLQRRLANSVC
ncbi:hypothetical protein AAG570_009371 [Ranatra chinensis]|uniref:Protein JTB n=1 Tax=Ranatra chinensis TaxID=642074 RepID=A0ABD0YNV7_9HEMI